MWIHLRKKSTPSKGYLEGQLLVSWQHPRGLLHCVPQIVAVGLRQKYWKVKRYFHLDYIHTHLHVEVQAERVPKDPVDGDVHGQHLAWHVLSLWWFSKEWISFLKKCI